jgi:hypothetical protein
MINQAGVVDQGLLGRVDVPSLCLLDYVGGWFFCAKAKLAIVAEREYVWLRAEHAVKELPLLFNPEATIESRKNQLSRLLDVLRAAGLIESVRIGRDLYVRQSDKAVALNNSRRAPTSKSVPTVTRRNDKSLTLGSDNSVTPPNDNYPPAIIDETTIRETNINETKSPYSPPRGSVSDNSFVCLVQQAEEIYAAYPRKVGHPAAIRAISKSLTKHPFNFILERTRLYAETYNGPAQYIPHPSTFFRQERFADDPTTWRRSDTSIHTPKIVRSDQFRCGTQKL